MVDMPPGGDARGSGIQVIARAAQILRAIKQSPGGMSQAELAAHLELPRTTIFRILSALEDEELVAAGSGNRGRYRIGSEIGRLASAATRDLVGLMHPYILELSAQLSETVDVSVLDGNRVTFIDQVDAPHRLRAASAVGESFPLHTCAPGKALMASLAPSRVQQLLPATLKASTDHTITSLVSLRAQLEEIRESGIAYDYEEQNEGICAAGMALVVAGTVLAVSIPMPAQRFEGREHECAEALLAFRERITKEDWA
jgi:DNA-binding IclR family transcriptional regulator